MKFRYPGDVFEPSAQEAARALSLAQELNDWITRAFFTLPPPDSDSASSSASPTFDF
jgi:hypothetical protein